jgi:hypothetical protein
MRVPEDEDLDRPMPGVRAVGITTDRPAPFRLPVLDDRGDVVARLAAIDAMVTDEDPGPSTPTASAGPFADGNDADVLAGTANTARGVAASRIPAGRATGPDALRRHGDPDAAGPAGGGQAASGSGGEASRGARVRAAATVPARARVLRPDGVEGPGTVSYTADDWRGHIKGAPARADAHVYGASPATGGDSPTTHRDARGSVSVPAPTPPAPPAGPTGTTTSNAAATIEPATHRAGPKHGQGTAATPEKPVSILDWAARIGLLGALIAIFVLLFIFGPRISQWWGKL